MNHPAHMRHAFMASTNARPHISCATSGAGTQLWLLLATEGYRHIVRTKNSEWGSDSGIALEQTCRAVHAWYNWTAEERGFVLHETSSKDEE